MCVRWQIASLEVLHASDVPAPPSINQSNRLLASGSTTQGEDRAQQSFFEKPASGLGLQPAYGGAISASRHVSTPPPSQTPLYSTASSNRVRLAYVFPLRPSSFVFICPVALLGMGRESGNLDLSAFTVSSLLLAVTRARLCVFCRQK